ncbi:MAG: hypothetical protein U0K79_02465 [Phascolarctobacterium sp.]|jgi:hypothetical protein|nr:hypothetical protein [Phascolarctobacterium sp.]
MKFVISNHHARVIFSSESPNCASAAHAAEFVQGAVPLGITQISWGSIGLCGVLFVSQNNKGFRTLEAIVPSHSFAKNHSSPAAYSLLNFKKQLILQKQKPYFFEH